VDYLPLSDSLKVTSDLATAQQKTDPKKEVTQCQQEF